MVHYTADGMLTQAIMGGVGAFYFWGEPPFRKLARAIQQPFRRFLAAPPALPIYEWAVGKGYLT